MSRAGPPSGRVTTTAGDLAKVFVPGRTTTNGVSADGHRVVVLSMSSEPGDEASVYRRGQKPIDDTLRS